MYRILQRLLSHTQTELQSTWSAVQERSAERRLWIDNTTKMLNTIEDERTNRVCNVLTVTYYTRVVAVFNAVTIPVSNSNLAKIDWMKAEYAAHLTGNSSINMISIINFFDYLVILYVCNLQVIYMTYGNLIMYYVWR